MFPDPTAAYLWLSIPQLPIDQALALNLLGQPTVSAKGFQTGLMREHQPNHSAFSPLTAEVQSCFHLGDVSVLGWIALAIPGGGLTRPNPSGPRRQQEFPLLLSTGHRGHCRNRGGAFGGYTCSTGPSSSCISLCVCVCVRSHTCLCMYPISYISLENLDFYREVEREVSGYSYKKITWGILVIELFCIMMWWCSYDLYL